MKYLAIIFLLSIMNVTAKADTIYIGDYTQYQAKYLKNIDLHQSPKDVLNSLTSLDYKKIDNVVLSTGVSNRCADYKVAEAQIKFLASKNINFIVIKDKSCFGVESVLRKACESSTKCKYKEFNELRFNEY